MASAYRGPETLSLRRFGRTSAEDLAAAFATGVSPSGYRYKFVFVFEHPHGPYYRVDSEKREEFLRHGTEEAAQADVIDMARAARQISGGEFHIHPFFGAVWGTCLTPVAESFGSNNGPTDDLSMIVSLARGREGFDEGLTAQSAAIGLTFRSGTRQAQQYMEYMEAADRANPNQATRDQAIGNGLGERWDAEYAKFQAPPGSSPMQATPANIARLLTTLRDQGKLLDVTVSVNRKQVARAMG